ncbi:MAG: hypothetical protein WCD04_06100 [Terriglobia bacterium]|jgi:hypothetical protein
MLTTLGLCLLVMQFPGAQYAEARQGDSIALKTKLQSRVTNYQLEADNFVCALLKVADEYKIPMGIVWVRTPVALRGVRLSEKDATVQEIIQALVKTQPEYTMTTKGGLLHISAPGLVPDRENFLRLKVPEFEVHNQVVELAERRLGDIVNATVWPPKPVAGGNVRGGVLSSQLVEVGDPDLNLKLQDVAVEDVLDALTLASDRGVWIVTFAAAGELTPTGFRQMESPLSSEALPRPAKPLWEILKWGRKPY